MKICGQFHTHWPSMLFTLHISCSFTFTKYSMHNRQSVKWINIKVTFYGWSEWRFWKLKEEHLRMWRVNKGCVRATYTAISITLYYSSLPLFIYAESHRIMIVPTFFCYNFPFIVSVINLWINHLAFPCPAVVYNKWGRWCEHPVPSVSDIWQILLEWNM